MRDWILLMNGKKGMGVGIILIENIQAAA